MEKFKRIRTEYDISDGNRVAEIDARGIVSTEVASEGVKPVVESIIKWGVTHYRFPGSKPFDTIKLVTDEGVMSGKLKENGDIVWEER